jgi:hypothetical protein
VSPQGAIIESPEWIEPEKAPVKPAH